MTNTYKEKTENIYTGQEAAVLARFREDYHPGVTNAFYSEEPFTNDHRRYEEKINGIQYECFLHDDGQVAFREVTNGESHE